MHYPRWSFLVYRYSEVKGINPGFKDGSSFAKLARSICHTRVQKKIEDEPLFTFANSE